MSVGLPICAWCLQGLIEGTGSALELELQTVGSHHVEWVLYKSRASLTAEPTPQCPLVEYFIPTLFHYFQEWRMEAGVTAQRLRAFLIIW